MASALPSSSERESFLRDGFLRVESAVDPGFLEETVRRGFARLGMDEADPGTWPRGWHHMPVTRAFPLLEYAPRAWELLCRILGGEARIAQPAIFCDNLILSLPGDEPPWRPDEPAASWHKDGDWFVHFLDSPEQAIVGIVFWRDVVPGQGGTYVACDSIGPVARVLEAHREGLADYDFGAHIDVCRDRREITGRAGDVVWLHPYALHSHSVNTTTRPRVISNTAVSLREPMRFDRPAGEHSLVEQAVLDALGVERLAYAPEGPRRRLHPEREREWARQREAERTRLTQAGRTRPEETGRADR